MNLKDLATQPSVHLANGRSLTIAGEHKDYTIFINQKSIKEHEAQKNTHIVELAITPSFKFKTPEQDLEVITKIVQEFSDSQAVSLKLNSRQHIYFESMHSVYGRKLDGKPIKLTYIKTHLSSK